jgi:hypothetical protein
MYILLLFGWIGLFAARVPPAKRIDARLYRPCENLNFGTILDKIGAGRIGENTGTSQSLTGVFALYPQMSPDEQMPIDQQQTLARHTSHVLCFGGRTCFGQALCSEAD